AIRHQGIVQVEGGIDVSGHQQQRIAQPHVRIGGDFQHAVFVVGGYIAQAVAAGHAGQAAFNGGGLKPRIHHRPALRGPAHDRSQQVKAMAESQRPRPVVGAVVAIHERVRARLQLGVHARRRIEFRAARTRTGNAVARDAGRTQRARAVGRQAGRARGRLGASSVAAHMLRRPVIGLQPAEAHTGQILHAPRQRHGFGHIGNAATALPDIDLDQHFDLGPGLCHGGGNIGQVAGVVHAHADAGRARQLRQQRQLGRPDDFVADVHVIDARRHERNRLADLLAADAAGAQGQLPSRNFRALVRLGVRAQAHVVAVGPGLHRPQVVFEGVQVQHEAGRVDPGQRVARRRSRNQTGDGYRRVGSHECAFLFRTNMRGARTDAHWMFHCGLVYPPLRRPPRLRAGSAPSVVYRQPGRVKLPRMTFQRTVTLTFAGLPICGPTVQTGTTMRHMFDILVYLFENYYTPQACPAADVLAKRLAAAGFEHDDIDDALGWLYGLAETTERCVDLAQAPSPGVRIYTDSEYQQPGTESIGFIAFLESAGVLPAPLREIVIDRALAAPETPVSLAKIKIIALMVLWSQEAEIDNLVLEELLDDDGVRRLH